MDMLNNSFGRLEVYSLKTACSNNQHYMYRIASMSIILTPEQCCMDKYLADVYPGTSTEKQLLQG